MTSPRLLLDILIPSGDVSRYHTVPDGGRRQSVAEHSWGVAMILMAMGCGHLAQAAILHDCAELEIGDIPAHAKWRHPALKEQAHAVEDAFNRDHELTILEELSDVDRRLLKIADMLELVIHAVRRVKQGNREYEVVVERGFEWFESNQPQMKYVIDVLNNLQEDYDNG